MPKASNWKIEETTFLQANYQRMSHKEIASNFPDRTITAVKNKLQKLGLVNEKFYWSDELLADLKKNYANTNTKDLAKKYGHSLRSVYQKAKQLGLKKSIEWIAANARENLARQDHPARLTQFRKGRASWNKGKKGLKFPGSEKGHFKKGHRPHNANPVGTESFVDGYWKVKIAEPNVWKWKQRLVWEKKFGKIPANHAIIFKDGNRNNFEIENLECLSRKELRLKNSLSNQYNPELRKTIHTLAGLKRRINKIKEAHNA